MPHLGGEPLSRPRREEGGCILPGFPALERLLLPLTDCALQHGNQPRVQADRPPLTIFREADAPRFIDAAFDLHPKPGDVPVPCLEAEGLPTPRSFDRHGPEARSVASLGPIRD